MNKVKKYLKETFKKENREKGIAPLIVIGLVMGATVLGGLAYTAYTDGFFGNLKEMSIRSVMGVLLWVAQALYNISRDLFSSIYSSATLNMPITKDATVIHGWSIVRDFANMFIVLGFVVVGIATILRLREYEAQKLLLPLILVAIFVNFSLLFCGIIIDATNITMKYFTQISGTSVITGHYDSIVNNPQFSTQLEKTVGNSSGASAMYQFVAAIASLSIFLGISAMIFFIYGILLLFRYVALMCLVILAPLAFVCYVFPATKPIFNKWWSQFLQWAIIGIPTSFFIYLGGHIMSQYVGNTNAIGINGPTLSYWVPTAFLFFGYTLIFQTSAIGAAGAIGLATGALGFAAGASKWAATKGGAFAAKATGATRAGRYIGDTATRIGESLGLVSRGTMAQRLESRQKEASGRINMLSKDEKAKIAKGFAYTAEQRNNKAAAIRSLIASGDSDVFKTPEEKAKAMAFVTSRSYKTGRGADEIKDFAKQDYRWAAHDNAKVQKYISDHPGTSQAAAEKAVTTQQLELNWGSMNAIQRRNVNVEHLTDDFIMSRTGADLKTFRGAPEATREHLHNRLSALSNQLKASIKQADDSKDVSELRRLTNLVNELNQIPKSQPKTKT